MRLTIKGIDIEILGDPHLGRPFYKGVPLHRRGEREAMQWTDFQASLTDVKGAQVHWMAGDLFDRPNVSNAVVAQAAQIYRAAAEASPATYFVASPGNHDISRDTTVVSSFELFAEIVRDKVIVPQRGVRQLDFREWSGPLLAFIPWHPTLTAEEFVRQEASKIEGADAVFGHWDVVAVSNTDNLIPAALLKELGVGQAITGHDHLRREIEIDGLPILVTGSMQPYSHAEDPERKLYWTVPADDVRSMLGLNPEYFANACVRVVGEWDDPVPNCLQWQVVKPEEIELESVDVGFEAFDFGALWNTAFEGVDPDINQELLETFRELGGEE